MEDQSLKAINGCAIATTIIIGGIYTLIFGFSINFFYGLALGAAINIGNFVFLGFMARVLLNTNRGKVQIRTYLSYIARLIIYGLGFFIILKTGKDGIIGLLLGYMVIFLGIYEVVFLKEFIIKKGINSKDRE